MFNRLCLDLHSLYNTIQEFTDLSENASFIMDQLSFPGTHWNNQLWIPCKQPVNIPLSGVDCLI